MAVIRGESKQKTEDKKEIKLHCIYYEKLLNANDFRDVARFLSLDLHDTNEVPIEKYERKTRVDIDVETRPVSTYTDILGGVSI